MGAAVIVQTFGGRFSSTPRLEVAACKPRHAEFNHESSVAPALPPGGGASQS
jgi:hypothetical protein